MRYSTSREINMLVRQLICEGWFYYRGSKHGRLQAPAGRPTLVVRLSAFIMLCIGVGISWNGVKLLLAEIGIHS